MARPLRIEYEDAFYHVFSRGNERRNIFRDRKDYLIFLSMLSELSEHFRVITHSYCLMKNHIHFLIQTKEANLSYFMKRLLGNYTMKFNRRHKRVGHLFQGRYKANIVEKESYFLELSRYIHNNPSKASAVQKARDYEWSSYKFFLNTPDPPGFLDTKTTLNEFASSDDYEQFVQDGLQSKFDPFKDAVGGVILGSDAFVERIKTMVGQKKNTKNVARLNEIRRLPLEKLNPVLKNQTLDMGIFVLYRWGKLSQHRISEMVGVSESHISRKLSRMKNELKSNPFFKTQIAQLETELEESRTDPLPLPV